MQGNSIGEFSEGVLGFYISSAASDAALDYSVAAPVVGLGSAPEPATSQVPSATILQVARLGDVSGSALDLVATFVTLTVVPGNLENELESAGGGTALLASFAPGGSTGLGQSLGLNDGDDDAGGDAVTASPQNEYQGTGAPGDRLAPGRGSPPGLTTRGRTCARGSSTKSVPTWLRDPTAMARSRARHTLRARRPPILLLATMRHDRNPSPGPIRRKIKIQASHLPSKHPPKLRRARSGEQA